MFMWERYKWTGRSICIPGYGKGKNMNQQGEACRMLLEGGQGEIIEKKSRFIATVSPVTSEAQAITFIEEVKKLCEKLL